MIILLFFMFLTWNNPPGHKEHAIYFIELNVLEGVTINDCMKNMKTYVSDIVESF